MFTVIHKNVTVSCGFYLLCMLMFLNESYQLHFTPLKSLFYALVFTKKE